MNPILKNNDNGTKFENSLLNVEGLTVEFSTSIGHSTAVKELSFHINKGETLGVVGESGSGKSVTALSLIRLVEFGGGRITSGSIEFLQKNGSKIYLHNQSNLQMRKIRGNEIAMIFQEPMTSLNPTFSVGDQITEAIQLHQGLKDKESWKMAHDVLEQVRIPEARRRLRQYPYELSGGMRQRVMIAMALACRPLLLIADEPSTALDVTIQAQILSLIKELQEELGMAVLFITHDMGVVSEMADRVLIMNGGKKVEEGNIFEMFRNPKDEYTKMLLKAVPRYGSMRGTSEPRRFSNESNPSYKTPRSNLVPIMDNEGEKILDVKNLSKRFPVYSGIFRRVTGYIHAVEDVSLTLKRGKTLAIVGESGCGKSTLARTILSLYKPSTGKIYFNGNEIQSLNISQMKPIRKKIQIIFQDPFASLNPKLRVSTLLKEPLIAHGIKSISEMEDRATKLLHKVSLPSDVMQRFPHEFSGGERQRICIARALMLNPDIIVADEAVSALDVSVRAQILDLLMDLQQELNLSYLFISHDLAVVEQIAHNIAVMYCGRMVETGPRDSVCTEPSHYYTKRLMSSIPVADPGSRPKSRSLDFSELPSIIHQPGYQPEPMFWKEISPGHSILETYN